MWDNHRRNRQGRRLVTSAQRQSPPPIPDGDPPAIPLTKAWEGQAAVDHSPRTTLVRCVDHSPRQEATIDAYRQRQPIACRPVAFRL
jgi:hypothetical protein